LFFQDGEKEERFLLKDAVDELKGGLIGKRLWDEYESWPMYSKFFDNMGPCRITSIIMMKRQH